MAYAYESFDLQKKTAAGQNVRLNDGGKKALTQRPNMDLAKVVLHELERQPLSRTELEKRTIQKDGTHATFEGIFHYLVRGGYISKRSPEHRAKYVVTEKGSKLLEAI